MGCSNPHPHCQIWATSFLPHQPDLKDRNMKKYYMKHKRPLLLDYVHKELEKQVNIYSQNNIRLSQVGVFRYQACMDI